MTRVLVTGGTGRLGRVLVSTLHDDGFTVRVMSRSAAPSGLPEDLEWVRADLTSGDGLTAALDGVDRVVHAATSPPNEPPYLKPSAVDVGGTKRLVERVERADVEQLVYASIVGIDEVPVSYYGHKVRAEEIVAGSTVPSVSVRATQFYTFLDEVFGGLRWLPVWLLPTDLELQPVPLDAVADEIASVVADVATDAPDIGGPEVLTLGELAAAWAAERGVRRPTVSLPLPGETARAMRDGALTTPENRYGAKTWSEWLAETPMGETRVAPEGVDALVGE